MHAEFYERWLEVDIQRCGPTNMAPVKAHKEKLGEMGGNWLEMEDFLPVSRHFAPPPFFLVLGTFIGTLLGTTPATWSGYF